MIFLLYYQHLLFVKASLEKILLLLSPQNKPDKMARDVLLEASLFCFLFCLPANILVQYLLWLNYIQWIFKTAFSVSIYYQYRLHLLLLTLWTDGTNSILILHDFPSSLVCCKPQLKSVHWRRGTWVRAERWPFPEVWLRKAAATCLNSGTKRLKVYSWY